MILNEEELDEEDVDGDEGIINRRLPINSYNHQIQVNGAVIKNNLQFKIPGQSHNDEEEGWENCKEEDEERKDGDMIG